MEVLNMSEARDKLPDTVNRVSYAGERFIIARRGKELAALVSLDDLAILNAIEDNIDIADAREILKNPKKISLEEAKAQLGF
jgi:prevent-host-death family protein